MESPATLLEAISMLETGKWSRADLATLIRERIGQWEPSVKAFSYIHEDAISSLADHRRMGPLAGMPIGVKDMMDVAEMPTTGGSKAYHWLAATDSEAVARLRSAGAVMIGKTNTQELAFGVVTPPTRNPWNLGYIPGGSSGGSAAAVATGMAFAALGTDTGGSVRIPASCCGTVGFKPSVERISRRGVMPLSTTLDHVGILTRTVSDARYLFRFLDQVPAANSTGQHRITRKLAVPFTYIQAVVDAYGERRFHQALEIFSELGFQLEPIEMESFAEWKQLQLAIRLPEAYRYHQTVLEGDKRSLLEGDLAERIDPGKKISAIDYLSANASRGEKIQEWTQRLSDYDGVIMPTLPCPVPRVGQSEVTVRDRVLPVWDALVYMTAPWNVLGFPAISIPCGLDSNGLPMGIQLIGSPMNDERLLDLAAQFQLQMGILDGPTLAI